MLFGVSPRERQSFQTVDGLCAEVRAGFGVEGRIASRQSEANQMLARVSCRGQSSSSDADGFRR